VAAHNAQSLTWTTVFEKPHCGNCFVPCVASRRTRRRLSGVRARGARWGQRCLTHGAHGVRAAPRLLCRGTACSGARPAALQLRAASTPLRAALACWSACGPLLPLAAHALSMPHAAAKQLHSSQVVRRRLSSSGPIPARTFMNTTILLVLISSSMAALSSGAMPVSGCGREGRVQLRRGGGVDAALLRSRGKEASMWQLMAAHAGKLVLQAGEESWMHSSCCFQGQCTAGCWGCAACYTCCHAVTPAALATSRSRRECCACLSCPTGLLTQTRGAAKGRVMDDPERASAAILQKLLMRNDMARNKLLG
jgi:hypothetical protein